MLSIRPVENDQDWQKARDVRTLVFIEEQACPPELEWDEHDATSRHVVGIVDGSVVATARWRIVPLGEGLAAKLERIAVLEPFRGHGYGRDLVAFLMDDARQMGLEAFVLHAQAHLEDFYASFGFERVGDVFDEAGIPHIKMRKA